MRRRRTTTKPPADSGSPRSPFGVPILGGRWPFRPNSVRSGPGPGGGLPTWPGGKRNSRCSAATSPLFDAVSRRPVKSSSTGRAATGRPRCSGGRSGRPMRTAGWMRIGWSGRTSRRRATSWRAWGWFVAAEDRSGERFAGVAVSLPGAGSPRGGAGGAGEGETAGDRWTRPMLKPQWILRRRRRGAVPGSSPGRPTCGLGFRKWKRRSGTAPARPVGRGRRRGGDSPAAGGRRDRRRGGGAGAHGRGEPRGSSCSCGDGRQRAR